MENANSRSYVLNYNVSGTCFLNRSPVPAMVLKSNRSGLWRHVIGTCHRLRWLCRKHSNNVARLDKTPVMHQSIPSTNIPPPGWPPGNFFKVVKFPAPPGQKMFAKLQPRGKKSRQKARPWGQFCGPSRQFCHDRETIRIFLVVFFSLAFFEFFQRL